MALAPLPFLNIVARWVSPCSTEKVKFENINFQHYQSLNSHSAGGRNNENRLLNFDILMLLGDNYGVNIYKNSRGTTATPSSNKVSVKILDCVFFRWLLQTNKQSLHL